jgi:hypothetical protein
MFRGAAAPRDVPVALPFDGVPVELPVSVTVL